MEDSIVARETPLPFPLDQEPESSLQIYREVFDLCDRDGNGYITKEELAQVCDQVSDEEVASSVLDNVMVCLDSDHNGHITFEEFKAGFQKFQKLQSETTAATTTVVNSTPSKPAVEEEVYESDPVPDEDEAAWREVADRIDPQRALRGTGVGDMWKELNHRDPALLENFESFLTEVISELRQSDMERSTMQTHVKRILEQHSREVSEMDHLLQEELQLARVNHQQTNANQTSRLSNHYSSLLAQREAVIEELASQETDLKHALQQKALKESQLKEDKTLLLTANRELQDRLDTTLRSESTSGLSSESGRVNGIPSAEEEEEEEGSAELAAPPTSVGLGGEGGGHTMQQRVEDEAMAAATTSPNSNLGLNMLQELGKDAPPNRRPQGSRAEGVSGAARGQEGHQPSGRMLELGPGLSSSSRVTADSAQVALDSSQESSGEGEGPVEGALPISPGNGAARVAHTGSLGHTAGIGMLSKALGHGNPGSSSPRISADGALELAGVIPRRNQLPSPPSPTTHPLSRVFKVIFLGESGVGKSSLIGTLSSGTFPTNVKSTVGLDYNVKTLLIGEETVVFQLWDTAGQERFNNALTPVYFRRADAFVVVYDVSNLKTFKATKKWISVIKAALREQPPIIMLVGNKTDMAKERCVTSEDGRELALELKALFSETSALSGDNVLQAHSTLAQLLLARENADLQEIRKSATAAPSTGSKCAC